MEEDMGGALMRFACLGSNHDLVGEIVLGCDGERWNGTAPTCVKRVIPTTTAPSVSKGNLVGASAASGVRANCEAVLGVALLLMSLAKMS
jgi:hypothetical protein